MSQTRSARPVSNRARRQAAKAAAARRRRWGFGGAGAATLVVAGVILGLHYANRSSGSAPTAAAAAPTAGHVAPAGTFTTLAGDTVNVASLRGRPTLVWFVATWCSSCQAGTQAMAQNLAKLRADGIRVDEVELYANLGQSGPSMGQFGKALAGAAFGDPDWVFGMSSASLTRTYDPKSYLDIYYLLNAEGQITYVNSSPGSTMVELLAAAGKLA
ncbi:MAG: TlpA family protein disulfide reductase [Acidimicrobiales bacterium]